MNLLVYYVLALVSTSEGIHSGSHEILNASCYNNEESKCKINPAGPRLSQDLSTPITRHIWCLRDGFVDSRVMVNGDDFLVPRNIATSSVLLANSV